MEMRQQMLSRLCLGQQSRLARERRCADEASAWLLLGLYAPRNSMHLPKGGALMRTLMESCWNCGKAVKVPADNNNMYTRICAPCKATLPNETPKFYFTVSKSGKVRDL